MEDGSTSKIDSFEADSEKVYIVVDHDERIISLWKGEKARVKLKFIGSRASQDVRKDYGFHYKTEVHDESDETDSFKSRILGMQIDDKPSGRPVPGSILDVGDIAGEFTSYAEAAAKQGITVSDEEITKRSSSPSGAVGKMGGIGARPQASFLSGGLDGEEPAILTKKEVYKVMQSDSKLEAKNILEGLGEPQGYSREMVVVGTTVYRMGGTADKLEFQDLDNPLDGIIMIKEYTPRIIAENGKVKAIELLKRTSEEASDDEMMTQDLADLTAMFMIEIG